MNEEAFNMSIRKLLKMFGITAQREIEHAVAKARESGRLGGAGTLPAKVTLEIAQIGLRAEIDGQIDLG
ncbi:MAG: hypothetical protein KGL36_08200 [Gammaproteobacteria bacterium]|nr:hypothetical protein [Gammaproteobacteria bacterium]